MPALFHQCCYRKTIFCLLGPPFQRELTASILSISLFRFIWFVQTKWNDTNQLIAVGYKNILRSPSKSFWHKDESSIASILLYVQNRNSSIIKWYRQWITTSVQWYTPAVFTFEIWQTNNRKKPTNQPPTFTLNLSKWMIKQRCELDLVHLNQLLNNLFTQFETDECAFISPMWFMWWAFIFNMLKKKNSNKLYCTLAYKFQSQTDDGLNPNDGFSIKISSILLHHYHHVKRELVMSEKVELINFHLK